MSTPPQYNSLLHTGLRNIASFTALGITLIIAGHMGEKNRMTVAMRKSFIVFGLGFLVIASLIRVLMTRDFPDDIRSQMTGWFALLGCVGVIEAALIIWTCFSVVH